MKQIAINNIKYTIMYFVQCKMTNKIFYNSNRIVLSNYVKQFLQTNYKALYLNIEPFSISAKYIILIICTFIYPFQIYLHLKFPT